MKPFPRSFSTLEIENTSLLILTILASLLGTMTSCKTVLERQNVRPLVLRDVPAQRLAYRFEPDVGRPQNANDNSSEKLAAIQNDFTTRRSADALLRTVTSPDGQRALALYGTDDEPGSTFRIDLYSADGKFLRNLTPPTMSCVFPETVDWSPDGALISFIAHKRILPSPTPTPPPGLEPTPEGSPEASPSIAPVFPNVPVFGTEQIYVCSRDGFDLRALTSRDGLIYFYFDWAPDNHALVALACKENEWNARERQHLLPAGRPRLISLDGSERLLDDRLTEALPAWSPDSSKVADGFESESTLEVMIYDAATNKPTQARLPLRDAMIAASLVYEQKSSKKNQSNASSVATSGARAGAKTLPPSYNPIITLEWVSPDKLYFQTAYVRLLQNETINTFPRWHLIALSPQAAVLR